MSNQSNTVVKTATKTTTVREGKKEKAMMNKIAKMHGVEEYKVSAAWEQFRRLKISEGLRVDSPEFISFMANREDFSVITDGFIGALERGDEVMGEELVTMSNEEQQLINEGGFNKESFYDGISDSAFEDAALVDKVTELACMGFSLKLRAEKGGVETSTMKSLASRETAFINPMKLENELEVKDFEFFSKVANSTLVGALTVKSTVVDFYARANSRGELMEFSKEKTAEDILVYSKSFPIKVVGEDGVMNNISESIDALMDKNADKMNAILKQGFAHTGAVNENIFASKGTPVDLEGSKLYVTVHPPMEYRNAIEDYAARWKPVTGLTPETVQVKTGEKGPFFIVIFREMKDGLPLGVNIKISREGRLANTARLISLFSEVEGVLFQEAREMAKTAIMSKEKIAFEKAVKCTIMPGDAWVMNKEEVEMGEEEEYLQLPIGIRRGGEKQAKASKAQRAKSLMAEIARITGNTVK